MGDDFTKLQHVGGQQFPPGPHFLNSGPYRTSGKLWLVRQMPRTLGSVWADCVLAEWLRASPQLQGHLSHCMLRWFQWLCLVSKQQGFRWEQIQLEVSVIFTRPLTILDL